MFSLATLGAAAAVAACGERKDQPASAAPDAAASPTPTLSNGDARDGGATANDVKDGGYTGPTIAALFLQTPVMSDMDWPKEDARRPGEKTSIRIGYIRQGARVPVIPEPHPKPNCKEGWYELLQGGFVCGKYASLDPNHPRIKLAPHPADMTAPLPYEYGYNVANGTPLYKTVPSRAERLELEPWLTPRKKRRPPPEESASSDDLDAGLTLVRAMQNDNPFGPAPEEEDSGVPWYLREYDGGKPQITLDELKGDGSMSRRMVKGFFVALDKELTANGGKWWKTTGGLLAPFDRIMVYKQASDFQGIWLDERAESGNDAGARPPIENLCKAGSKAQVAIVTMFRAKKHVVSADKKSVTAGDPLPRHTVVRLTGESAVVSGARYDETDEGWWMRTVDGVKTKPSEPPRDLTPNEKWIDVNIKTQTLVAYEGEKPVYATAVSTGLEDKDDPEKDHKTPTGTFRIREKHVAATMDGDVASDSPYSIEDVPWIMYFKGSYALHGAFWHNQFGRTKSHGCVNLAPRDAKALFGWTEPHLPDGWHGVMATAERPGTRVVVHE